MKYRQILIMMIISISLLLIMGLFFAFCVSPMVLGLDHGASSVRQIIEIITLWVCCTPCFITLYLALKVALILKRERFFTDIVAKQIRISGFLVGVSSLTFLLSNIIHIIIIQNLNDSIFEIMCGVISIIGVVVGFTLLTIANFIKKANEYKEDSENII